MGLKCRGISKSVLVFHGPYAENLKFEKYKQILTYHADKSCPSNTRIGLQVHKVLMFDSLSYISKITRNQHLDIQVSIERQRSKQVYIKILGKYNYILTTCRHYIGICSTLL